MHEVFRKYITEKTSVPLNEEEFELIKKVYLPKRIRRRQYLLQEGEVCRQMAFIVKGAMRQYAVDQDGEDNIINFGIENWWMSDRESFLMETPSKYNIDAQEDSDVLLVTKEANEDLRNRIPAMQQLFRMLDEKHYIASQKRIKAAISLTAEERYNELMNTYPEFLQRFPQHMIASYLGISPETLSTIRKPSSQK